MEKNKMKANTAEAVELPQITYSEEKILLKDLGQRIVFEEDYLHVFSEGDWSVDDEKLGMKTQKHYYNDKHIAKDFIGCIEMYFFNAGQKWAVDFFDTSVGFDSKIDAKIFYNKLVKWKFQNKK